MCVETKCETWEDKYRRVLRLIDSLERRMLNFEIGNQPPKPSQWIAYVDNDGNLISIPIHESYRPNNNWKQIKVREVIE